MAPFSQITLHDGHLCRVSLKGLLQPFKGKGSLETWASQCMALRDDLIGLAQRQVLQQARAYPFTSARRATGPADRLAQGRPSCAGATTTVRPWAWPCGSSCSTSPATPASLIDDLYAMELQRIALNMQISLHSMSMRPTCARNAPRQDADAGRATYLCGRCPRACRVRFYIPATTPKESP